MTVNKLGAHHNWPGMGTRVIRLWDTHTRWMNIEPARGQWDFQRVDLYVDYAERHGAQVLLTLGQAPAWAVSDPKARCFYESGCSPPRNLDDWRNYVRALATRYGSRVEYWELWNEPDIPQFWRGTPAQLATMAGIAREEILRANPKAKLVGPAVTSGGMVFLDQFLASPGSKALTAISFHTYLVSSPYELAKTLKQVRSVAATHGRNTLPLWFTEFGVSCGKPGTACPHGNAAAGYAAVERVAASLFVMAAEGVQNADFYNWEWGPPNAPFALTSPPDYARLTPAGQVYAAVAALLDGAVVTESFENEGLMVVRFSNRGRDYVALWSDRHSGSLRPPANWRYARYQLLNGIVLRQQSDGLHLPQRTLVIGSS
jgi:hypothetical protein